MTRESTGGDAVGVLGDPANFSLIVGTVSSLP
jgi:hypothetical protein